MEHFVTAQTHFMVVGRPHTWPLDAGTTRLPVVALQVLQQRDALFEPLQIISRGAVFAS